LLLIICPFIRFIKPYATSVTRVSYQHIDTGKLKPLPVFVTWLARLIL